MRIQTFERVVYEHNPLAEVVCQVQFGRVGDLTDEERTSLREQLSGAGYSGFAEEVAFGFTQQVVVNESGAAHSPPIAFPQARLCHFSSGDHAWRLSMAPDFVAVTCLKYTGWDAFLPRVLQAARAFSELRPNAIPSRMGLRYKDVIEREALGLSGVPWHELIEPFLLGPLAPGALAEGQVPDESEIANFLSQSLLRLDHAMLLLQSSLLASTDGQRRAFLIDADFYDEGGLDERLLADPEVLSARLEALHASAGALFRRGITERLHRALRPGV